MFWRFVYNVFAIPLMFIAYHIMGCWNRKIREGIVGRREVFSKLEKQLGTSRNLDKTAWFHFTSVGEFEQSKPLIEVLHTDTRIVLTYFSPSVAPNVASYKFVDAAVYLPFDTRRNAVRLANLIKPNCLVFSRYDMWPNLVWQVSKLGIPIVVIAGTIHAESRRLGAISRSFFKSIHQHISLICAISEADSVRFKRLSHVPNQVVVTGDTRYEQVDRKAMSVGNNSEFFPGQSTLRRPILIAGSTYAEDEKIVLDAFQILRQQESGIVLKLILVPHEPTPERIRDITADLKRRNLSYDRYSALTSDANLEHTDVVIIDTVGMLAKLYGLADIAFVGGSFHGSVHNVME
ncbi:hypothetical protein F4X73_03500, partial [Candidatus Poribacteria bacterium]|nr:hypothetical protein [Candidatus Poribacteria bacterium]